MLKEKRKKNLTTKNTLPSKVSFRNKDKIMTFPDKQKLREFLTMRQALQDMLKRGLQAEVKDINKKYENI